MVSADLSETVNNFFKQNLNFEQTSFNSVTGNFEKSFGTFVRNDDNSIEIEIISPFNEKYFINYDGIEIYDLDFDQKKYIKFEDISYGLLSIINNDFTADDLSINYYDEKNFTLINNGNEYSFEILNENNIQIRYKDNMSIDTLINFIKS